MKYKKSRSKKTSVLLKRKNVWSTEMIQRYAVVLAAGQGSRMNLSSV